MLGVKHRLKHGSHGYARLSHWKPVLRQQSAKLALLKILVQRDLQARYKGSVLGNLWPVLTQLSQLFIYTYVFSVVLKVRLSAQGLPEENRNVSFGLWLFAALVAWTAVTGGIISGASSVLRQKNLVTKVVFPLALVPLVPVCTAFIESLFGLIILIVMVGLLTQQVHATLLLMPLVWGTQLLFTAGLAYLAAGLTVFLRDVPQVIGVVLNFWFYATPIIYPVSLIPQPLQVWVFRLNPMAAIAEMYRDIILVGDVTHWQAWFTASVISLVIFLGGFWCYRRLRPAFADVL